MTDAMPERVLMVPDGASGSSGHYYAATGRGTGIAIYVPEQRALDAERGMGMAAQECIIRDGIIAALRAEGEVMEVVGHRYDTDGRPTLTVAGLYGEQIQTGDRVRVVRVEEAP